MFVAVDRALSAIEVGRVVALPAIVAELRSARTLMVPTLAHYLLVLRLVLGAVSRAAGRRLLGKEVEDSGVENVLGRVDGKGL